MRRRLALASSLVLAALVVLAGPADAHARRGRRPVDYGVRLDATLSGPAERPSFGDLDGAGSFVMRIKPNGMLCFILEYAGTQPIRAGHIHRGRVEEAGPVVVTLTTSPDSPQRACPGVADLALAREIIANPENFYVNVHNPEFPAGALRGQLHR